MSTMILRPNSSQNHDNIGTYVLRYIETVTGSIDFKHILYMYPGTQSAQDALCNAELFHLVTSYTHLHSTDRPFPPVRANTGQIQSPKLHFINDVPVFLYHGLLWY